MFNFGVAVPEQGLPSLEPFCYLFADLWLFGCSVFACCWSTVNRHGDVKPVATCLWGPVADDGKFRANEGWKMEKRFRLSPFFIFHRVS